MGAVVVHDGRLLVVRRGRPPGEGLWSLPGGRLQRGERLAEGVLRELAEETGLVGRVIGFCGLAERISPAWHYVIVDLWVELETVGPPPEPTPGDDAAAARWVTRSEFEALAQVDGLHSFLEAHDVLARLTR